MLPVSDAWISSLFPIVLRRLLLLQLMLRAI